MAMYNASLAGGGSSVTIDGVEYEGSLELTSNKNVNVMILNDTTPTYAINAKCCLNNDKIYIAYGDYLYMLDNPEWVNLGSMPQRFYRIVSMNNVIYGYYDANYGLYKYENSIWTKMNASIVSTNGNGGSLIVFRDKLYYFGTLGNQSAYHYYNGRSWVQGGTMPITNYFGNATVLNDEVHIIYRAKQHYKFNGSTWTNVSTAPITLYDNPLVGINNELHLIGGDNDKSYYKYDGSTWTKVSTLPFSTERSGSCVDNNNNIHILGGYDDSSREMYYYLHYILATEVFTKN